MKIKLLFALAVFLTSCSVNKRLYYTGQYTVDTRNGDITTFKGIKGKYVVLSDTLKPNDVIKINVVRLYVK